jgi:alpha-1,6-mannosyltransferase
MKIVDVCAFYSPRGGGVKTYVGQKLAIAKRMGQDITILAPGDQDAVVEFGPCARIQTIASPRFPLDRKYWYFNDERVLHAALDALAPDFVEASSPCQRYPRRLSCTPILCPPTPIDGWSPSSVVRRSTDGL